MRRFYFIIGLLLGSFAIHAQTETVHFSFTGGFYENCFSLELSYDNPQHHIRYTVNGNRPTAQSALYKDPLMLDERQYSASDIYTIVNCPEDEFYLADSVRHCIVIRAAVFDENDNCVGPVTTNSYFIHALGCDTHGLPVVSLCADSVDLFDYETGIFVPGAFFDTLNPNKSGNYYQKGREWERLANLEYYELNNTGVNQICGLRTHGEITRRYQQKGMKVFAREEYGKKRFHHAFFENIQNSSFKRLTFKPFASAWNGSGCKDYIAGRIAQDIGLEFQASRPSALYLNGEFWGIFYIAEKIDERYLQDHFNVNIDSVNIIGSWNGEIDYGSADHYFNLFNWIMETDLSQQEAYQQLEDKIDIDNFIDYQIFEIFSANLDWPNHNMRLWQEGNGKWRWIFFDGDACLESRSFDAFANAVYVGPNTYPSSTHATLFFRKMLENEEFKQQFSARFYQFLDSELAYSNTGQYFNSIKNTLAPMVPQQIERFGIPIDYNTWRWYCMATIDSFLRNRSFDIYEQLPDVLECDSPMVYAFNVYPNPSNGAFYVKFHSQETENHKIELFDVLGRLVYHESVFGASENNEIRINAPLQSGIYLLKAGNHTQRIVRY